jgi:hypothetical protein
MTGYKGEMGENNRLLNVLRTAMEPLYQYCEDCLIFYDRWKFLSDEDTGHAGHRIRSLTDEEMVECLKDDLEEGDIWENFF